MKPLAAGVHRKGPRIREKFKSITVGNRELSFEISQILATQIATLGHQCGEISPHDKSGVCELHNQTMTVTTIAEAAT
jgi:hypothetical protein